MHFGLAAFPHVPDTLSPSTTPSSLFSHSSSSTPHPPPPLPCPPLPPTARTTWLPVYLWPLAIPRPRLYLAGLQTDRLMGPDANTQSAWQSERASRREGERARERESEKEGGLCMDVGGGDSENVCEWDSLLPCGHWSSRFPRGVCECAKCARVVHVGGGARAGVMHGVKFQGWLWHCLPSLDGWLAGSYINLRREVRKQQSCTHAPTLLSRAHTP